MDRQELLGEGKKFGRFLRKVREGKKLSLDAVEEMSTAYAERLTKSHLSRIENGLAEPTFRKLFALSQIYGVPLTSLAEEFEFDLQREIQRVEVAGKPQEEVDAEAVRLMEAGRYVEALLLFTAAIDDLSRDGAGERGERARWRRQCRLGACNCLIHLGRYESAKLEVEKLLGDPDLSPGQRLAALQYFVTSCYRLGRLTVALMGLEQAERDLEARDVPDGPRADFATLRGNIHAMAGRFEEAKAAYARALNLRETGGQTFETCKVRINMAWVLMKTGAPEAAREQLDAALLVAEASGYDRLRALAMSHLAVLAFERGETGAAETWAIRSNSIARPREFLTLVFRNCYWLARIAETTGDEAGVRANRRTLRALLSRVDENLPEAEAFRAVLAGGES